MRRKNTAQRIRKNDIKLRSGDKIPIYVDILINYIMKTFLSLTIFSIIYRNIYESNATTLLTKVSEIVLFSTIASMFSTVIVAIIYKYVANSYKRSARNNLLSVRIFTTLDMTMYEMLSTIINAVLISIGYITIIRSYATTFYMFFIIYVIVKLASNIVAYLVTKILYRKIYFIMMLSMTYSSLLVFSLIKVIIEHGLW